ncbi:HU family DNA-binding protein [Oceanicola sp. 22II-s10i]|uniref:HU family DNA-binding protein n=1 Tax=Oceanicola sp. 22II-s10i TaxID=1317116 RepID=UPI0020CBF6C1|nr:HU family DNA-binding protein [Oceanicola sp. 22II-s10i]
MAKTHTSTGTDDPESTGSETRARAAKAAVAPDLSLVTEAVPTVTGPELKKRELIDRVVALSGVKKKDAKLVVEATLQVMGEVIAEGRDLNVKPLGKLKVNRIKQSNGGTVMNARIRQNEVPAEASDLVDTDGKDALAEGDE